MNRMNRILSGLGAICSGCGVALGAFGAHYVQLSPHEEQLWRTATTYLMVHGIAAMALRDGVWPKRLWLFGSGLFSTALLVLALGGPRALGAVAPVGGLCMIVGWALASIQLMRKRP